MPHQTFIAERKKQIGEIRNLLTKHFYFADETLMQLSPGANQWCIAEHLAHINLANYHYLNQLPETRATQQSINQNIVVKHTLLGRLLIWGMGTDEKGKPKLKLPAPKSLIPVTVLHPETKLNNRAVFEDFLASLDLIEKTIERLSGTAFIKIKFRTAIANLPKINLYDALLVMEIHTKRHLNKMIEIKEATA
jgi:hypothetical protein